MQEIFNEGRVIGLSAYEQYVRHHMEEYGEDPENPPASERAWLASSITMGTSLLLKLDPNITGPGTTTKNWEGGEGSEGKYWGVEIKIPTKSRLCSASQIIGSLFIGEGVLDADNRPFCKSVKDYGFLSTDTGQSNYNNMTMSPNKITYYDKQIKEYSKLIDGVVIQPCRDWTKYLPDLHDSPKIRLLFRNKIDTTFYLLLTGFTDCSVISGTSLHIKNPKYSPLPVTGDFLGPAVFPWSSKILLTVPNATVSLLLADKFSRSLKDTTTNNYSGVQGGSSPYKIKEDPIIDMNHARFVEFHDNSSSMLKTFKSRLQENVKKYTPIGEGINQLSVVSRDNGRYDSPALFGRTVTQLGDEQYLYPIDCAAPGTLKAYPDIAMNRDGRNTSVDEELKAFWKNRPGCYPLIMQDNFTMYRASLIGNTLSRWPIGDHFKGTIPLASLKPNESVAGKVGRYLKIMNGNKVRYTLELHKDLSSNSDVDTETSITGACAKNENESVLSDDTEISTSGTGDYVMVDSVADSRMGKQGYRDNDINVNYISLRTMSYAMFENKRLDLLGQALRIFRNNIKRDNDKKLTCYISIDFNKPMVFNKDVTFKSNVVLTNDASFTADCPATFKKDVTFEKNISVWGHLQLKMHRPRACGGAAPTSNSKNAEVHIDMLHNGDGSKADIKNFAIGIGQTKGNEGNTGASKDKQAGYITMANGLRLYISAVEPIDTDIPEGSIGIGWGMS